MTKYSTDSKDSDSQQGGSDEPSKNITVSISDWLKEALDQIVKQSNVGAREALRRPLEYAVIEWHRTFERQNDGFDVPGDHIWGPDFRCLHCHSSNKFLFRELNTEGEDPDILCLNCEEKMSKEEVTRLSRAAEIQEEEPYTLGKEGGKQRGSMRDSSAPRCGSSAQSVKNETWFYQTQAQLMSSSAPDAEKQEKYSTKSMDRALRDSKNTRQTNITQNQALSQ